MGFLDKLFGGKPEAPVDNGIYIYARCDSCGRVVHTRLDPEPDLIADGEGFRRRKTLIDDRCFRRIPMIATFDHNKKLTSLELQGGTRIDRETWLAEKDAPRRPPSGPSETP